MKSLNEQYTGNSSNVYETFADLIFCALIVLVLFVMTLAIEVSQRVRTKVAAIPEVSVVKDVASLSAEEVAELSKELQQQKAALESQRSAMLEQQEEIRRLGEVAKKQREKVASHVAALQGEQRFTGATEPSKVLVAYNYRTDKVVFVRQKEFAHATTQKAGESILEYLARSTRELVQLALLSREQRFYSLDEANAIFSAFTEYQQINPTRSSYTITSELISLSYALKLSAFIAGDEELTDSAEREIELAINRGFRTSAGPSDSMYPSATVTVLVNQKRLLLDGVSMSANEFKDVLLAFGGRGVMLDFEGYAGSPPDWLTKEVLEPTGYIGKTPKVPSGL
ncbi:hypothetical protein [Rhodopirellula europaea]|uniref:hypothetical protein n=1 Tax=Rhodopirellula europaea TaxID=1263866 RepID=UPI003D265B26